MRTLAVVTVSRADYGIWIPVLREIQTDPDLELRLIVAGAHLAPEFGYTASAIEADGFEIDERVEMLLASDTPEGISKSMGLGLIGFSQIFARSRPDILLALGDRFETIAGPLAALPFKIPVAHLHGGEETEGAIDNSIRHALTKLSHLHFVSTDIYAQRVIQMGEEPWRVMVSGAPALDHLRTLPLWNIEELKARLGLRFDQSPLLVTFHPVTLEYEQVEWQIGELLGALAGCDLPILFTLPNADTGGRIIIQKIEAFVSQQPNAQMVQNLGTRGYFSVMKIAAAMVGNSSSGIIEASSFELPVVNIGTRQAGRIRAGNVLDVGYTREEIIAGIRQALQPSFRAALRGIVNPYGDGHAASRIVTKLKEIALDDHLLVKHFHA